MTTGNFDAIFKLVVGEEGGYVNDPADRGGPTKFGVTQAVLAAWRRHPVTADDVKNLQLAEAKLIFKAQYWSKIQGDKLPPGIDLIMADTAYNSGAGRAIELMQKTLGVKVDRILGEVTLANLTDTDPLEVIDEFSKNRLAFLKTTYGWARYHNGWTARVSRVREAAVAMTHPDIQEAVKLVSLPPSEGTQADHDQAVTRTPAGKAKVIAAAGALGTAAADAAHQVQPLMDLLPTLKWMFIGLTIVGIAAGFYVQIRQLGQESAQ